VARRVTLSGVLSSFRDPLLAAVGCGSGCYPCSMLDARGIGAMSLGDGPPDRPIDRDACMGSGNSLPWAPAVFDLDDEGVAIVTGGFAGHEEEVRVAEANCRTSANRVDGLLPMALPES